MPVPYIGYWHFTENFPLNFKTRADAQFSVGEISCEMPVPYIVNWHFTRNFPNFLRACLQQLTLSLCLGNKTVKCQFLLGYGDSPLVDDCFSCY